MSHAPSVRSAHGLIGMQTGARRCVTRVWTSQNVLARPASASELSLQEPEQQLRRHTDAPPGCIAATQSNPGAQSSPDAHVTPSTPVGFAERHAVVRFEPGAESRQPVASLDPPPASSSTGVAQDVVPVGRGARPSSSGQHWPGDAAQSGCPNLARSKPRPPSAEVPSAAFGEPGRSSANPAPDPRFSVFDALHALLAMPDAHASAKAKPNANAKRARAR
jgi:hypothetical protein